MKRNLVVLAGLIVLTGAVGAMAGQTKQKGQAAAELDSQAELDALLSPIPQATPVASPDEQAKATRMDLLVDGGFYGVTNPDFCGLQLQLDRAYRKIVLVSIPNPFSTRTCPDVGHVLIGTCSGDDAQNCPMKDGRALSVLPNGSFVILDPSTQPGEPKDEGIEYGYARESVLPFGGKMQDRDEMAANKNKDPLCVNLEGIVVDGGLKACRARGFVSCEVVKDSLTILQDRNISGGHECEVTVLIDGKDSVPPVKSKWPW